MATRKGLEPSTSSVTGWHSKPTELPGHEWWAFRDLNPGPIGYEPTALTTELKAHGLLPERRPRRKKKGMTLPGFEPELPP